MADMDKADAKTDADAAKVRSNKNVLLTIDRLKVAMSAEDGQRKREIACLEFQVPEKQWPEEVRQNRGASSVGGIKIPARPMLSVSTIDEPIQLVRNQEKAAHLSVNIHPLDENATDETAEVLKGLYRSIETDSRAHLARSWAFGRTVYAGRGVYRIVKEYDYSTGTPGDQKIVIKRMLYQDQAWLDPFAEEPDKCDMEWGIVVTDMPWTKYKRLYKTKPNGEPSRLALLTDGELTALGVAQPGWVNGDTEASRTVRVAEHYYLEYDEPDEVEGVTAKGVPTTAKTEPKRRVRWCLVNAVEEMDSEEWDGQYIPLILSVGNELIPFDKERRYTGMVENAKDGVRLTNYAASGAVEMSALEPKAPWQGAEGVFKGHEDEYQQSNIRNIPYLQHAGYDAQGQRFAPPARVQVDMSRLGPSMELLRMGRDFVQAATMTYDPALGKQPTAHRSGIAIGKLQDQTVVGTSQYLANEADISMTYEARVVLDLIPHIYDRPGRIARLLDENYEASSTVMLNQPFYPDPNTKRPVPVQTAGVNPTRLSEDQRNSVKHYDLNKGRYGVSVTIGKSTGSRLQEGSDEMGQIMQAEPNLVPIIGPEYFRYRDFPGAKLIAKLLKKMRDHQFPFLRDEKDTPTAAEQLQQAEAAMKEMNAQLQDVTKALETDREKYKAQVAIEYLKQEAEKHIQAMKNAAAIEMKKIDALIKGVVLDKTAENEARALQEEHDAAAEQTGVEQAHDAGMAAQDTAAAAAAQALEHAQATQAAQGDQAHEFAMSQTPPVTPADGSGTPPTDGAPPQ